MSDRLKTLREKRGRIGADMRAIIDAVEAEGRDLTDEELAKHGELFDAQEVLRGQIQAEERQVEIDREMAERAAAEDKAKATDGGEGGGGESREVPALGAFRRWLMSGQIMGDGAEEFRALQADVDTSGGFLVAPEQFV
ncbi:MAG: phage major capsid protein, partial [Alphaproteobacteria bacterium]|nr:phage major capsid protein [Alphaproteobacteria bacterium]